MSTPVSTDSVSTDSVSTSLSMPVSTDSMRLQVLKLRVALLSEFLSSLRAFVRACGVGGADCVAVREVTTEALVKRGSHTQADRQEQLARFFRAVFSYVSHAPPSMSRSESPFPSLSHTRADRQEQLARFFRAVFSYVSHTPPSMSLSESPFPSLSHTRADRQEQLARFFRAVFSYVSHTPPSMSLSESPFPSLSHTRADCQELLAPLLQGRLLIRESHTAVHVPV